MHRFMCFLCVFMILFYDYDDAYMIIYDICMHDYMMMHDAVYFLYVMIDVPL